MKPNEYSVGTEIRFVYQYEDCRGLKGRIIDIIDGNPLIYLPKSHCISCYSTKVRPATLQCDWDDIEPVSVKGEQYLFGFMNNDKR